MKTQKTILQFANSGQWRLRKQFYNSQIRDNEDSEKQFENSIIRDNEASENNSIIRKFGTMKTMNK